MQRLCLKSRALQRDLPRCGVQIRKQGHRRQRRIHAQCEADAQGKDDGAEASPARQSAAVLVEKLVTNDSIVGVDSGDLCTAVIQEIGAALQRGDLTSVRVIAASDAAASEAAFVGVPQALSADVTEVDVMFAEADLVDIESAGLPFIIGAKSEPAQPQLPRLRAAAKKARAFVALVASEQQAVSRLSGTLPVFVRGEGWEETADELDDLVLGDAEIWRRPVDSNAKDAKLSPSGGDYPYVSPEGYNIVDIRFYNEVGVLGEFDGDYERVYREMMAVSGVAAVGLLAGVATAVAICEGDSVRVFNKEELAAAVEAAAEAAAATDDTAAAQ